MEPREPLALGAVQKTLLLPLWGRATESAKPHPQLSDPTAAAIVATLPYDFVTMARGLNPITQLSWVARSLHIDRMARAFLERRPDAAIVNLGCGLDTTFERVDNGRLQWFDVDLPDVIALRRGLIPEADRRHAVAGSLFDDSWRRRVESRDAVLIVAAGVFYYFREDQVRALLSDLSGEFPGAEVIFDACSPLGRRISNKMVLEAGGMDPGAKLQWGLRRARAIEAWDDRIAVIEAYPMFCGMRRGLSLGEKAGTLFSDALNMMSIVHLRFAAASG